MIRNILTKKSKDIFKPQRRRAVSGPIVAILIIVVATTDLIGTASIVDSVDLSKQTLYSAQEFVSITVKNSGTTPITDIKAYLLIANATSCLNTGVHPASIGDGTKDYDLDPGESVTISGDLKNTNLATDINCKTVANGDIDKRQEYIIRVDGKGEGEATTSFTTTVRSR